MADVTVVRGRAIPQTIYLLTPNTPAGREWIEKNIGPDNGFQPWYPTVVCEHHYLDDIVNGMREDGLGVD